MSTEFFFQTIILSTAPISELRGGIPFAVAHGIPIWIAFCVAVCANLFVAPIVFVFLEIIHAFFMRVALYRRFVYPILERAHRKVGVYVNRFGYIGLLMFVMIPLPVTGAYTATFGAWALGLDRKKSLIAISAGVVCAGIIVSSVVYFGIEALRFFIRS